LVEGHEMNALERVVTEMLTKLIPPHEHKWKLCDGWYWECRCGAQSLLVADRSVHSEDA
jgi:hypothetical protein